MVPPTLLWLPPPIAFAPEDIPKKVRQNAHWYKVMKSSGVTQNPGVENERRYRIALSHFASKNAAEFPKSQRRSRTWNLETVLDFCRAVGRFPSRQTRASQLIKEARTWHRRLLEQKPLHSEIDLLLPQLEIETKLDSNFKVRPLVSSKMLKEEGMEMRHCVSSRIQQARTGEWFYFSIHEGNLRLTVELRKLPDGLVITEMKGHANRFPTLAENSQVQAWVQDMNQREIKIRFP
jgi:hypothetical protein